MIKAISLSTEGTIEQEDIDIDDLFGADALVKVVRAPRLTDRFGDAPAPVMLTKDSREPQKPNLHATRFFFPADYRATMHIDGPVYIVGETEVNGSRTLVDVPNCVTEESIASLSERFSDH